MKIAIPGGSGQVGSMLARAFAAREDDVVVLSRRASGWTAALLRASGVLMVGTLAFSDIAAGQVDERVSRTIAVGVGQFDMSGTSTAAVVRGSVEKPVFSKRAILEVALGYSGVQEQFAVRKTHILFYEAQLQGQVRLARLRPYVGVGVGGAGLLSNAGDRERVTGAASASGGIRADLTARHALRLEVRLRRWDFTHGSTGWNEGAVEYTVGLSF